ncbi:hypothetical protein ACFOUP_09120 [Belliella kenyensis]|uniref:NigD-like protein n=1 Tax=Belliella kenyensis TaxID=1472724 RepID=A0ABV8EMG1_9BACT|nr:hypothetical protein [Belliella kenyensis]MCH7403232.1 hypothetical protein [Belliella kenyensis]MDN3604843.1 hypothetical protein [Belliella kenyensis]
MYRYLVQFLCVCLFFLGCREVEQPNYDIGLDFQPLEEGLFWEYEVDERIVFGENDEETNSYFIKDRVDYTFINDEGVEVFVILRSKGNTRNDYEGVGNYALFVRNRALIRMEQNERVVKFPFPPRQGSQWDAKIYSSNPSEIFQIDLLGSYDLNNVTYSQAARVLQEDDDDLITSRDIRYEVFAKGIGMIEYYSEVISYCTRNDCLGQQIEESGSMIHMKIINYGKN